MCIRDSIYAKQYFFRFDRTRKYQFDSEQNNSENCETSADVYKRQICVCVCVFK